MKIYSLFAPPKFDDPDQERAARLLYGLLRLIVAAFVLLVLVTFVFQPENIGRALTTTTLIILISFTSFVLLRRQRLRAASLLCVIQLWLVVTVSALTGGGMETPAVQGYLLVILAAGLLIGWRWGLLTTLVCTATQIAFAYAETAGLLPDFRGVRNPLTYLIVYTLISGLVIIFVYYYTSSIRTALNLAKQELSERKRAEQALRESEARMRVFADATFEGITISVNERIVESNDQFARMMGYATAEIVGVEIAQLAAPESIELVRRHIAGQYVGPYEAVLVRKDGTTVPVEVRGQPFEYRGQMARLSAVRDLTERKKAEADLVESEKQFRELLESAPDAMVIVNERGLITLVNSQTEQLFGYPRSEILGQPVEILMPERFRQKHEQHRNAFIAAPRIRSMSVEYDFWALHKDGSEFPAAISLSPLQQEGRLFISSSIRDVTANKAAEEHSQRQLAHITTLHAIASANLSNIELQSILNLVIEHVVARLGADAAAFSLLNPHMATLEFAIGSGFHTSAFQQEHSRLGDDYAGEAALSQRLVHIPDIAAAPGAAPRKVRMLEEGFISYLAVPLIAKSEVKGVLEIFHRAAVQFEAEWLDYVTALAGQAAIAIDSLSLLQALKRQNLELALAYDVTLEGWSKALDLRDKETEGHSLRVTEMTVRLARAMGLAEDELASIRQGALLHDVGKLGIPDSILLKPDELTDEETAIMRKHPTYAYEWLSKIAYLQPALAIPYCHHEKWDGSGYPRGLQGEAIPLAARLFAIVDVYDALTSDRPYRPAWTKEKVMEYIKDQNGKHFDPQVVEIFMQMLR